MIPEKEWEDEDQEISDDYNELNPDFKQPLVVNSDIADDNDEDDEDEDYDDDDDDDEDDEEAKKDKNDF